MKPDGSLLLAIVGCGAVVEHCHLPAMRHLPGVKVGALVEKDPARLRRLGSRYQGAKLCRDVDELPAEIDAAIVAVPPALHAPIAVNLLRRGIHVLCEKPMATTVDACRDMIEAARETGAVLMVGHHKRFVPSVQKARQLLDDRRLGAISRITGSMGMPRTWRSHTAFHLDPWLSGGGVLIDNGIHLIDLVTCLVGTVDVQGGCTLPEGNPMEAEAKIEFLAAGGAVGVLRFSHCTVLPNVLRIEGERGFIEFDTYDSPSLKVFLNGVRLCRSAGSVLLTWPRVSPHRRQLEHFVGFIRGSEPTLQSGGEEAMQAVVVVTQAYSRLGRLIS